MPIKKKFSADKKTCTVTFTVESEATLGAQTINLAGDFNSWSSKETPLKKAKDGSFSVTLDLEAGKEYQFRYLLDDSRWENDWKADKYIPAPFSSTDNSVVICIPGPEAEAKPKRAACKKTAAPKKAK